MPRARLLDIAGWLLSAAAAMLILSNFDFGFRITADQLQDTFFAITHTPAEWVERAWEIARYQGRIGHFLVYLLFYAGGYFGDLPVYPFICYAIFLAIALAPFAWAQMLAGTRLALPLFGVFLGLVPVGFYHWLPNSYAMQFLPLALGLTARAAWLAMPRLHWAGQLALALPVFVAALSFEICLAMLAAMSVIELWLRGRYAGSAVVARGRLTRAYVLGGWAVILVALVLYAGFRLAFPSNYAGNQLPTLGTLGWGVPTTLMHILTGPSLIWIIVRLVLGMEVDLWRMLGALTAAAGVYVLVLRLVWPARPMVKTLMAGGFILALFVTAPIGFNAKYVEWCTTGADCSYLDSRLALVGLCIALPLLVLVIVREEGRALHVVAFLAALSAGVGYLANAEWREGLDDVQTAERQAQRFICADTSGSADPSALIAALVASPVNFHPAYTNADKRAHWTAYVRHLREHRWWPCPAAGG